ncbi:hypothetical protein BKA70DRAFT_1401263 [Coprinopsis sp. MPI-PUGE-AT-0042]|nr:hypothetical protein BKA70DRAFT_1401263 [Coprinopsis sp. MPI-PUGE-AT-0042]
MVAIELEAIDGAVRETRDRDLQCRPGTAVAPKTSLVLALASDSQSGERLINTINLAWTWPGGSPTWRYVFKSIRATRPVALKSFFPPTTSIPLANLLAAALDNDDNDDSDDDRDTERDFIGDHVDIQWLLPRVYFASAHRHSHSLRDESHPALTQNIWDAFLLACFSSIGDQRKQGPWIYITFSFTAGALIPLFDGERGGDSRRRTDENRPYSKAQSGMALINPYLSGNRHTRPCQIGAPDQRWDLAPPGSPSPIWHAFYGWHSVGMEWHGLVLGPGFVRCVRNPLGWYMRLNFLSFAFPSLVQPSFPGHTRNKIAFCIPLVLQITCSASPSLTSFDILICIDQQVS